MNSTAITLAQVSKRYGAISALSGINLEVCRGEFVSLIGPSGCGKTTVLRIIAGLDEPTDGMVTLFGESPKKIAREHNIGVAFQRPALIPSRTALSNVSLTLEVAKGQKDKAKAQELLIEFGLGDFLHHYPHQLSGGMQQRVNIACALVHEPAVLLLDEPFGALDELKRESMAEWLDVVLAADPKTVVFVTHSVEEAVILSDRIILLSTRPGRIYAEFEVCYPHPRRKKMRADPQFLRKVAAVREALYEVVNGD